MYAIGPSRPLRPAMIDAEPGGRPGTPSVFAGTTATPLLLSRLSDGMNFSGAASTSLSTCLETATSPTPTNGLALVVGSVGPPLVLAVLREPSVSDGTAS